MSTVSTRFAEIVCLVRRTAFGLLAAFWVLSLALQGASAETVFDDFNDGNDDGWTRVDPIAAVVGGSFATFTFPNGGYRIEASPSPDPDILGPARAGSIREDVAFDDFVLTFDLLTFDGALLGNSFGAMARVTDLGVGTTNAYTFGYYHRDGIAELIRIEGETPTSWIALQQFGQLDPDHEYRFVFTGIGSTLTGSIYDLGDLSTPLVQISADDGAYASGHTGLYVYDWQCKFAPGTADATFGSFSVAIPEPSAVTLVVFGLVAWLLRRRHRS